MISLGLVRLAAPSFSRDDYLLLDKILFSSTLSVKMNISKVFILVTPWFQQFNMLKASMFPLQCNLMLFKTCWKFHRHRGQIACERNLLNSILAYRKGVPTILWDISNALSISGIWMTLVWESWSKGVHQKKKQGNDPKILVNFFVNW